MRYKYKRRESCKMLEKVKQENGGDSYKVDTSAVGTSPEKQVRFILHIKKKIC